jgi:hypothetical protein
MKWQMLTGVLVVCFYSFAFCAGESHVPPQNPGQDTTSGAGYGGSGAGGESQAMPLAAVSLFGGFSFPVSDLSERYKVGWNAGGQALYMVMPRFYLGPSFFFNRWSAKKNDFTFFNTSGAPITGLTADGYSWLTDLELAGRFTMPLHTSLITPFVQLGAGWFHYRQNVNASGALNVLSITTDLDGFVSSYGLGVSFLANPHVGIDFFPAFHFNVSNRPPINFFTTNLAITGIF